MTIVTFKRVSIGTTVVDQNIYICASDLRSEWAIALSSVLVQLEFYRFRL